jgi:putative PIN family toxin of toxin-antitoxin system
MSRLVLDTNSLIQVLPRKSKYRFIWERIIDGSDQLCVTTEILEEYLEILTKLTNKSVAQNAIALIINNPSTVFITTYYHFNLITVDPDDNKFVDCAIVANAKYIITNDKHFNVLSNCGFPKVPFVRLDQLVSPTNITGKP